MNEKRPLQDIENEYKTCALQLGDLKYKHNLLGVGCDELLAKMAVLSKEVQVNYPEALKAEPSPAPSAKPDDAPASKVE